jgi:adenylosuccinate lyase
MMMRKHEVEGAYEKLKEITRGQQVSEEQMSEFIETIEVPELDKEILRKLKPWNYVGLASELTCMLDTLD